MKKLRTQLALLTLLVASLGILGTAFYMTRSYIDDKKNYIVEVSSRAAPNIADAISKRLADLISKAVLFESAMEETSHKASKKPPSQFLTKIFDSTSGISEIRIYRNRKLIHNIELDATNRSDDAILLPETASKTFLRSPQRNELFYFVPSPVSNGTGFYLFRIQHSFFQTSYELAPALQPTLIDLSGDPFFQAPEPPLNSLKVKSLLSELDRGVVIAQEIQDTNENKELLVLASVQETDNASILLSVPMVKALDLLQPVFQSNFYFLVALFFVSVLLSALFALKVARPIEELTEASMKIAKGEWKVPEAKKGSFEMNRLIRAFGKMVTDLQTRELEIRRANQELVRSERLAALGRFGAGIAHEVKNPLASILGYTQLIKRKLPAPLEVKETQYVDFIMDETKRASKIINDLLMFARQKPPELKNQSIRPLLERTADLYRPQAESAGIKLIVELDFDTDKIIPTLDFDQFIQVLTNLVSNALQAHESTPPGDKRVTLRAFVEPGRLLIDVRDNGPGISEENLKRLFEPFFSTKEVGKGSGLGLALSLGIVELHQGKIEVTSKPGEGTSFLITLPLPSVG